MRPNCCHISFAFILKILNFLQAFIGILIIIYSIWMLNQWNHQIPLAPSPQSSFSLLFNAQSESVRVSGQQIIPLNFGDNMVSGFDDGLELGLGFDLNSLKLPAPWFIYSFMGVGIMLCCVTFIGCIAAEALHGCCLCFYTVLITVLVLLEAALVAFIAIDHQWEKDLPFDPTGELDSFRSFIEDNIDLCKWVGITAVVIQGLSLLLAIILRAMVCTRRNDLDDEDDYIDRMTMEPPGRSGWPRIYRDDFESNPAAYFRGLRDEKRTIRQG